MLGRASSRGRGQGQCRAGIKGQGRCWRDEVKKEGQHLELGFPKGKRLRS